MKLQGTHSILVLGHKVCIFRTESDEIIALGDACPQRNLPCSKDRFKGDNAKSSYHGLVFDCAGKCVWAPGQGGYRPMQMYTAFLSHEKYRLAWN
jgi:vanillate O-demethylase monooxygenase subunit